MLCRLQAHAAPKAAPNERLNKVKAGAKAQADGPETPPQDEAQQVKVRARVWNICCRVFGV